MTAPPASGQADQPRTKAEKRHTAARRRSAASDKQPKWMGRLDPEGPEGPLTPRKVSESEYMTVEWPPDVGAPADAPAIQFLLKITDKTVNVSTGVLELKTKPVENTISPRQLGFDPPLENFGKGDAKGFRHYWEMLDYVFNLPNPNTFPRLPIPPGSDDAEGIMRFIEMCRRLAGFSVINEATTLSVGKDPGTDDWHVRW